MRRAFFLFLKENIEVFMVMDVFLKTNIIQANDLAILLVVLDQTTNVY